MANEVIDSRYSRGSAADVKTGRVVVAHVGGGRMGAVDDHEAARRVSVTAIDSAVAGAAVR